MKARRYIVHLISMMLVLIWPARAQLVPDGATNTLRNVTNIVNGELVVGSNASFTLLIVSDNVYVTNYGVSIIGRNFPAKSNELHLISPTARWWTSKLLVGARGPFSRFVVSNGATVHSSFGDIGEENGSNTVVVSGPGSSWTNGAGIQVGLGNGGNRFVISDGARVLSASGLIGNFAASSNNYVLVSGSGSVWTNYRSYIAVGGSGGGNTLIISNAGRVDAFSSSYIGGAGSHNQVQVTGPGSLLTVAAGFDAGYGGWSNRLSISNGGQLVSRAGRIGVNNTSVGNAVIITDPGSFWSNDNDFDVGHDGARNTLLISNGAALLNSNGRLGLLSRSGSNEVVVTGTGSVWSNRQSLLVGGSGRGNRLLINSKGMVFASNLIVGSNSISSNNLVVIDGGSLCVTNAMGNGALDVRRGTNTFNAGVIQLDQLLLTNAPGRFEFNGGALSVKNSTVSNRQPFQVGNSVSSATLELSGNGMHSFADGLLVSPQARLIGNGTLIGNVSVEGTISAGASIGRLTVAGSLTMSSGSSNLFELNKNVGAHDSITVAGNVVYGGTLIVTNLGGTLTHGDSFRLFDATTYSGVFHRIALPTLDSGLSWKNNLLVDGALHVTAIRDFGASISDSQGAIEIRFTSTPGARFTLLGTTDPALPLIDWEELGAIPEISPGQFQFIDPPATNRAQRFYVVRSP